MKVIDYRNRNQLVPLSPRRGNDVPSSPSKISPRTEDSYTVMNDSTTSCVLQLADGTGDYSVSHHLEDTTQSSAMWGEEQGFTEDISLMVKAMAKKTQERAVRYTNKADKALSEAVAGYSKENPKDSLGFMRKHSYYKVRAAHMRGAHCQLKALINKLDDTNNGASLSSSLNNFSNDVPEKLRRLQEMIKKTPVSADTDRKLLHELAIIANERQRQKKRST